MAYAFSSTNPNLNRAVNELNKRYGSILSNYAVSLSSVFGGSGISAAAGDMEKAIQWGLGRVGKISYSQLNRQLGNLNATVLDCSAFVLTALLAGGIDMISLGAYSTHNMREKLVGSGLFRWIPTTTGDIYSENLIRGDILLCDSTTTSNHTQFYIGNNTDLSVGPTYGCSTSTHRVHYSYNAADGWTGTLRYIPSESAISSGSGAGGGFSSGGGSGTGGGGGGAN